MESKGEYVCRIENEAYIITSSGPDCPIKLVLANIVDKLKDLPTILTQMNNAGLWVRMRSFGFEFPMNSTAILPFQEFPHLIKPSQRHSGFPCFEFSSIQSYDTPGFLFSFEPHMRSLKEIEIRHFFEFQDMEVFKTVNTMSFKDYLETCLSNATWKEIIKDWSYQYFMVSPRGQRRITKNATVWSYLQSLFKNDKMIMDWKLVYKMSAPLNLDSRVFMAVKKCVDQANFKDFLEDVVQLISEGISTLQLEMGISFLKELIPNSTDPIFNGIIQRPSFVNELMNFYKQADNWLGFQVDGSSFSIAFSSPVMFLDNAIKSKQLILSHGLIIIQDSKSASYSFLSNEEFKCDEKSKVVKYFPILEVEIIPDFTVHKATLSTPTYNSLFAMDDGKMFELFIVFTLLKRKLRSNTFHLNLKHFRDTTIQLEHSNATQISYCVVCSEDIWHGSISMENFVSTVELMYKKVNLDIISAWNISPNHIRCFVADMVSIQNPSLAFTSMELFKISDVMQSFRLQSVQLLRRQIDEFDKMLTQKKLLHFAAMYSSNPEMIRLLTRYSMYEFDSGASNHLPIQLALRNSSLGSIEPFLDDFDLNYGDAKGLTAFEYSALNREMMPVLLAHSFQINHTLDLQVPSLIYAIVNNDLEAVSMLIKHPDPSINSPTEEGLYPLHFCINNGNLKILKEVISCPLLDPNACSANYPHPLHYLITTKGNSPDFLDALLILLSNSRIDVNFPNKMGQTPLYCLLDVEMNKYDAVRAMLGDRRCFYDVPCNNGEKMETPLMKAMALKDQMLIKALTEAGATPFIF